MQLGARNALVMIAVVLGLALLIAGAYALNATRERHSGFWSPDAATPTQTQEAGPPPSTAGPPAASVVPGAAANTEPSEAIAPPVPSVATDDVARQIARASEAAAQSSDANAPDPVPKAARHSTEPRRLPSEPVEENDAHAPRYSEQDGQADQVPGEASPDELYAQRRSECRGGFLGSNCRSRIRHQLCDGLWSESPPPGQTVCQLKNR